MPPTAPRRPLSHLSPAVYALPALQLAGRDEVVAVVQHGGPPPVEGDVGDTADRRLFIGRRFLDACLKAARASVTSRAVLLGFGAHARLVEEPGHSYELVTLYADGVIPEDHSFVRAIMGNTTDASLEALYREETPPLGRGRVTREVLYADEGHRLTFELYDLLTLVGYCERSPSGWMQIHRFGVRVKTFRGKSGLYNVCTVVGVKPESVMS